MDVLFLLLCSSFFVKIWDERGRYFSDSILSCWARNLYFLIKSTYVVFSKFDYGCNFNCSLSLKEVIRVGKQDDKTSQRRLLSFMKFTNPSRNKLWDIFFKSGMLIYEYILVVKLPKTKYMYLIIALNNGHALWE